MKKFTLLLTSLVASVGTMFAAVPANGVYKLWHLDAENADTRGYMIQNLTTNTLHPRGARLNGYTDATHSVPANADGSWNENWYLYTSIYTGHSYIFSVNNGKFLAYVNGIEKEKVFTLSDTPATFVIEEASTASQYKIRATSSTAYYFGNSIGHEEKSNNHTVNQTYRFNEPNDAAVPHSFAAVAGALSTAEDNTIDEAIRKIDEAENVARITKTYTEDATYWSLSPVFPAGINNSTSFTKDNKTDNASGHFNNTEHTHYKAVTAIEKTNDKDIIVKVKYADGSHGIITLGVDVLDANGEVVKSDYHISFSGGAHVNNTYTLSDLPAGKYMLRCYVCNKSGDHELTKTKGSVTIRGAAELSTENAKAMFDSLVAIADRDYNSAPGRYELTDAIKTAKAATAEDAAGYAKNFAALDDAMETRTIALPKAGKFYRFQNVTSQLFITSIVNAGNDLTLVAEDEKPLESIFYYDGQHLVAWSDGKVVGNYNSGEPELSWKTVLKDAANAGVISFPQSTSGTFYIQTQLDRRLYGAAQTGRGNAVDCAGLATGLDYSWIITEVTELPVYTGGEALFTVFSPVALNVSDDLEVYESTISESAVVTTKVAIGEIHANTATLVKNGDDSLDEYPEYVNFTLNYESEAAAVMLAEENATDEALTGSIYATAIAEGTTYYTLQGNDVDNDVATANYLDFMPYASTDNVIPGFTVRITNSTDSKPAYYEVSGEGKTTGIEEIVVETGKVQGIYDLQGRKLSAPVKGINIINGKKVLVK